MRRQEVRVTPAGDAGRDHRGRDRGGTIGRAELRDPAPVDGHAERLADPDVVERRLADIEAVVLGAQRRHFDQLRAKTLVVGDPRGIEATDRRVVQVAVLEHLHRAATADVADELDGLDGGLAGPVVRVRLEDHGRAVLLGQDVAAAGDEAIAGQQGGRVLPHPGRHDPEGRAGDHIDELGAGTRQVDGHVAGGVVRVEAHGGRVARLAGDVFERAVHAEHQARERRRGLGIDDAQPAANDVGRSERRPVGELEAGPQVEDDPLAAILDPPRLGEGGPDLAVGIERRERLEELGGDLRAAGIALGGRVEGRGGAGQDARDPRRVGGRPRAGCQRQRHGQ